MMTIPPAAASGEEIDYYKLSKDQYGCRYLQKQLENESGDSEFLDTVFKKLLTNYQELSIDPFGNYLLQKIVEYLDEPSLELLILELQPNLYTISKNQYGTRSLQKIIDCIYHQDSLTEILITDGFMKIDLVDIVDLINDVNGNHVIQKCIFKFKNFHYDFIINAMIHNNNIIKISKNKHGCCVLQKLLSNCNINQMYELMLKILEFDFELINDQFGNYIVQFLLDVETEITFEKNSAKNKMPLNLNYILKFMELENLDLIKLSCLKFSSNVIEKLLIKFFEKLNQYMKITKDIDIKNDGNLVLLQTHMLSIIHLFNFNITTLIKDNFGNYTLQTLLDTTNYNNLIERYWNLINKYKPLENMKNQESFKLTVNPPGWADEDLGNNFDEELKLQKTFKFFSDLIKVDETVSHHDIFVINFIIEINELINSTHSLLGQIKNTSYSKKIKIKLKKYYQEIYHSNTFSKSLNAPNHHRYQSQEEIFNSNTGAIHSNGTSNGNPRAHFNPHSKHNRSRGHSTSQNFHNSNNKSLATPKQKAANNIVDSSSDEATRKHMRNVSTGAVILDSFTTTATTPIEETQYQGDTVLDGYFEPSMLSNGNQGTMSLNMAFSNYGFAYDTYQNNQMADQQQMMHQRHFSLPLNSFNNDPSANKPDNIWAMKNNHSINNSGYNSYNFSTMNNRNHARTTSLVDQNSYGKSNFAISETQQATAGNQYNNYTSGYVSPGSYRTMQLGTQQNNYPKMNFNSVDYTDGYSGAQGRSLNVGNNTVIGHKKESLSNASNNTTMSANFSNITNLTAYTSMTPLAGGHKSHASIGSISIGSDGSLPGNNSIISSAHVSNGPWNYPAVVPLNNNQQHIRHSSQGSIWMEGYSSNVSNVNNANHNSSVPSHNRTSSFSQGFSYQQPLGVQQGFNPSTQKQQQLQEPEFVSLSQQYGFS